MKKKKAFDKLDKKVGPETSDALIKVIDIVSMEIFDKIDKKFDEQNTRIEREISGIHKEISKELTDIHKEISNKNKFQFSTLLTILGTSIALLLSFYGAFELFSKFIK